MKGIYIQKNSPYYWLRYYDKLETDPSRKRKSVNTKIPVTEADRKRYEKGEKLVGTQQLRNLVREFKAGLAERDLQAKSGVRLKKQLLLSDALKEFAEIRTIPGIKKFLKQKTLENYNIAVNHFINACGDKYIYKYNDKDYYKLLFYFEKKKLSKNSRSIYTRTLHSLWKYFVDKKYVSKNIIEPIDSEEKDPNPILFEDMYTIIQSFKEDTKYPHHYWLIYFMLLTGCRPSSAMVQMKEDIDFKRKQIIIRNIKAGELKGKPYYRFPLYKELENLLIVMNVSPGDKGRLFPMYKINPRNYTYPLSFWERKINTLYNEGKIEKRYTLKQIRSTTASFLINILKMDIFTVKKLLDHANIQITDKNYIDYNVNVARKDLDKFTLKNLKKVL
ncbi:MAG: tyrosine-type recombinase/integrase [Candidatus Pacearchaeota archaeon]